MTDLIRKIINATLSVISTTFGSISWISGSSKAQTFCDPINVKPANNQDLISFLQENDNRIAFLDTYIDVSIADSKHVQTVEQESSDSDAITSSSFSALSLPLAYSGSSCVTAIFYFCENYILKYSAEKDVIRFEIKGFFRISRTFHGWTAVFQLTEVKSTEEGVRPL
ncbi:MAG TPA: hypothetical protein VHO90_17670 [Bacteroidales bacterium]|nr:hypothetical protein [Bacteroidales bacterium]